MRFLVLFFISVLFFSCSNNNKEGFSKEFMQSARGEVDEIILVMDSTQWEGLIGSVIRQTFREPVQGLPQDEPMFTINKVSPLKLNTVLKSAVNMVFVMTLDSETRESSALRSYFTDQSLNMIKKDTGRFYLTKRDEFAKGQTVMYLFASSEDLLKNKLEQNKDNIQSFFEERTISSIKKKLFKSTEKQIEKSIDEDYDFSLSVPFGYEVAKQLPNFFWIRRLDAATEQNVFIYSEPYISETVFDDLAEFRDRVSETYLRDSEKQEIFITRQDRDDLQTMFQAPVNFNDNYAVQLRGLWKVSDNTAGGPYISYLLVDEESQMLYYLEGYVYGPGGKKKMMIREVDAIISTFKLKK